MDRERVLAGIDPRRSVIAEIGPLTSPIARRDEGEVIYIDHADTEALRLKYAQHTKVDVTQIVDVDAIWGENTLQQALGDGRKVDYVLASHVIEHVPDPIGWFGEIGEVLRPGGELRLVIPDRRFTFDILRSETRLADLLFAHLTHARAPLPLLVMDHLLEAAQVDTGQIWQNLQTRDTVERLSDDLHAIIAIGRDALENRSYHDVHSWVLTPRSFALLMKRAAEMRLIAFECVSHIDTAPYTLEFYVFMRPCSDAAAAAASWQRMADSVEVDLPCKSPDVIAQRERERLAEIARQEEARARLETELQARTVERDMAQRRIDAIAKSTSWRITRPLRVLSRAVRRPKA